MAAGATEFERVGEMAHKLADNLSKAEKSSDQMGMSWLKIGIALKGAEIFQHVFEKIVIQSQMGLRIQQAFTKENLNVVALTQSRNTLLEQYYGYIRKNTNIDRLQSEGYKRGLESRGHEVQLVEKQLRFATELQAIGKTRLVLLGMAVAAGREMWMNARSLNQNLIEAESSWQNRSKLMRQTLVTQVQLGASFEGITRSAAALVHFNLDASDSFETNLRLVTQMHQGLGVSEMEAAKLATVVERQLGGSFKGISDVISEIVDKTALAGSEATRLATTISTALGRLRPGMSATTLPEVVRLVGRYESALKEVGGSSGAFQQLLTQLTTPEGLVGAGALGVNPEFLATSQGVQSVMDRFAKYGQMLVGQSQGWERQMRLQAMAQIFNVTADQANQMLIAIQRANTAQMGQISTQERWKEQLNSTNSGIQRLGNSLMGLLQGAMYPLVFIVGALANRLADAVQWVTQYKEVVYAAGAVLLVSAAALALSMVNLARALWQTVWASTAAQAVLTRHAALQGVGALGRVGGGVGALLKPLVWIARGIAGIGVSMAAIVGLLGWSIGIALRTRYWIQKGVEDNIAAQKIILTQRDKLESDRRLRTVRVARYSDDPAAELMGVLERRLIGILGGEDSWTEKRRKMALANEEFEQDVLAARVTRGMHTPLLERTPQEQKIDAELRDLSDETLVVNEKMEKHMLQSIQLERDRIEEERNEGVRNRSVAPMRYPARRY